jgi:hypothetical protein
MAYNIASPNRLREPLDPANLLQSFDREAEGITSDAIRHVLHYVASNLEFFVRWSVKPVLLWPGCTRIAPEGKNHRYHQFPELIRRLAKDLKIQLDGRPNGPAIASFLLAGGERPARFGSSNKWSIHHTYSGKFPYLDRDDTLHATQKPRHFTQSAGLIAAHPIADALSDEFPFFAWRLRAESFRLFGYDPDGVFSPTQDENGFASGHTCEVVDIG